MKNWLTIAGAALLLGACTSPTDTTTQGYNHEKECTPHLGNPYLRHCQEWETTYEGQRQADLGDGTYLNPIMSGDRPDPSILKDGDDYYMTFSSFEAYPALTIWHSKDLVNWEPVGPAVTEYIGSIWAPELTKHEGRYYLYIPAKMPGNNNIYVAYADNIEGPWSDPIPLGNDRIDPGHAVGEDGKRYLFLSHSERVQLSDDGLRIVDKTENVYDGWMYPEEWDVECYCQEGPKIMKHGGYYHMILAVGGTAGPPTGHMVIHARSKSIDGPWVNSPHNPIVRTESAAEKWWSRGHATLVEGPTEDDWYMMYHGYENGYHTLGRQTLLEPVKWTEDGWLLTKDYDMSQPIPKPKGGETMKHSMPLSDDFTENKLGIQWSFFRGDTKENERITYHHDEGVLELEAEGNSPRDSSPLTFIAGDQAYQFEVTMELDDNAKGGAILFYNDKLYAGVGFTTDRVYLHRYGMDQRDHDRPDSNRVRVRVTNDRHILTIHYSLDEGETWTKYDTQMDVSGYHHNVAYGFMSLRPAIYAAGEGSVRFSDLEYRALP